MSLLDFQCRHQFAGGFDLDIEFRLDHRFTALFGPSGSGKTTILSIIAGFLQPRSGHVRLADWTVLDTDKRLHLPPHRRRVGVVFQDFLLFPHLSVEQNLRYGPRHGRGCGNKVEFSRVVEVLEISHLLGRQPRTLSGGESQRVALGRALLSGPDLLLMDEPLASLEAPLKARILDYLRRTVEVWNIPALFVTHEQAEVRRAADRVVVIDKGRLVASGTPEEALGQPTALGWANSAAPVNLLRLDQAAESGPAGGASVGGQALVLPPHDGIAPSFVEFSPADVILSRQDVTGLSARNHLRGRVRRIVPVNQAVFVAVDVGQIVWVEVTPQSVTELDLIPDCEVVCLIKTHSMRVVAATVAWHNLGVLKAKR